MADNDVLISEDPAVEEEPFVANGVTFDGMHSYTEFGMWLSKRPELRSPEPKTNYVEVPGMDGYLDFTEANAGEVKFTNRELIFTFAAQVKIADQETFKGKVRNALHGKKIKQVILDEDPGWYYTGRATVEFEDVCPWKMLCVVTVDAEPYAMKVEQTEVDLLDPGEGVLNRIYVGEDVAKMGWNTDVRLGTVEFPQGLVAPEFAQEWLQYSWPEEPNTLGWIQIQVADSKGHVFNFPKATWDPDGQTEAMFNLSAVLQAGVEQQYIYRVLFMGVGGCRLFWELYSWRFAVENSRKTVFPVFELETEDAEVPIVVNGENYTILPGKSMREDIPLHSGENEILLSPYAVADTSVFKMTFREGKL